MDASADDKRYDVLSMWEIDNPMAPRDYPQLRFHLIPPGTTSYPACMRYALSVWFGSKRYDLLFAGGLRLPLCFALCNLLLPWRRVTVYAGVSVFLEVPSRNPLRRLFQIVKNSVLRRGVARFMVLSTEELERYHRVWNIPRERMQVIQFKIIDEQSLAALPRAEEPYLYTGGNSERDYTVFFDAVRGLPLPVRVLSTRDFSAFDVPDNVEIVHNDGSTAAFYGPMARARLVVIPLRAGQLRSSGQGTYLSAMALGKPLIVSGVAGTRDLIEDGETGVLVEPGDAGALREAIFELWDDPERARGIGERAQSVVLERNSHDRYMRTHFDNMLELCRGR